MSATGFRSVSSSTRSSPSDSARGSLEEAHKSLVYLPEEAVITTRGEATFARYADTGICIRSLDGASPRIDGSVLCTVGGTGNVAGFVVELANVDDFDSMKAFIESCLSQTRLVRDEEDVLKFHYTSLSGDEITFRYADTGDWEEMQFDWGYGLTEQQVGFHSSEWQYPDWPGGPGHGRVPVVEVNGVEVKPLAQEVIIDGPQLKLQSGVLSILDHSGKVRHRVDFSRARPVFQDSAP